MSAKREIQAVMTPDEVAERWRVSVRHYGAQTGPQWPKLSSALIRARSLISEASHG